MERMKYDEHQRLVGQYQTNQYMHNICRGRKKGTKRIFEQIVKKNSKFDERK